MKTTKNYQLLSVLLAAVVITVLMLPAGNSFAQSKRPITVDDFGMFKTVKGQQISDNGEWIAYEVKPEKGDGQVIVINLKDGRQYAAERGSKPFFSDDSKWVAYVILVHEKSDEEKRAERKAKKEQKDKKKEPKEKNDFELLNLASGEKFRADDVKGFKFSDDSKWIAYLLEKPEPAEEEEKEEKEKDKKTGSELILRTLSSGNEEHVQFVSDYGFTEKSAYFFYSVSSETEDDNGVFVKDLNKKTAPKAVLSGKGRYKEITWNEDADCMIFLSDRDDQQSETPGYSLFMWRAGSDAAETLIDPVTTRGFPEGMELAEYDLQFSKDGESVYINIGEKKEPVVEEDDGEEKASVYVWHWKDVDLVPQQQKRYTGKTTGSHHTRREWSWADVDSLYQSVFHIDDRKFVRLEENLAQHVTIAPKNGFAVGADESVYREERPWRPLYADYYIVNLSDGSWEPLEMNTRWSYQWSNDGQYLLQYAEPDWFVYDMKSGIKKNLTGDLDVAFWDTDDDHPMVKSPWGLAGWSKDDEGVLLYDKYDVWFFPVKEGGAPVNLTKGVGRNNDIRFRYWKVDTEEEFIDLKKPLQLITFNYRNKAEGIYQVEAGKDPQEIVTLDKHMGRPHKAKNADVNMFTLSTFHEYGDIWVSDEKFGNMRKISDANPDNHGILWGRAQLIDYRNMDGVPLQAILILPENYVEGKKYPMIIYYYEKLTQSLHNYRAPRTGSGFTAPEFTSNGYVVLIPDIIYAYGFPGPSSVKCVVGAAQKVIDMGIADSKKIGITGHSWGGYQTAYIITRTNIFACAYAGAPVSNMTSAYGGIRWGSGNPRTFQYERTQSRIGGTLWEYPERYIENSPLFFADRINTPIMMLHGDEDGAVPWYQSIEYFLALRRLDKPAWFLQYGGEAHGLKNEANKKDFTIRRMQFFDHFLKDKPMPEWMEKGQSIFADPRKK